MGIRVLLADDHKIVREGLRSLLERAPDIEVVAEAENGSEAIARAAAFRADLVLMDLTMPEINGVDATRRITAENPHVRVIVLTMHSEKRFITEAFDAGAKGYLLKESASDELLVAVRAVAGGDTYLSRSLKTVSGCSPKASAGKPVPTTSPLAPREREVLQQIAEGKSTKEMAFSFGVSIKTIESQRRQIMKKLDLQNVAQLTKYAIREGFSLL